MSVSPIRRRPPSEPGGRSAARLALADAVADYLAANARQSALKTASEAAAEAVFTARSAVEAAAEGVELAKRQAIEHAISVATGGASEPPMTVRAASARLVDAEADLTTAIAARDELTEAAAQAGGGWHAARDAATAVIHTEARDHAEALIGEVEKLLSELARKAAELRELAPIIYGRSEFGAIANRRVNVVLNHVQSDFWHGFEAEQSAGRAKWQAAINALMADASAPLP